MEKNKENLSKLIVMCGLQCSGKSTKAKETQKEYNAIILSSDNIRLDNPDWDNGKVFNQLHNDMNDYLNINKNVIVDATNINIKMRQQLFANIKEDCYKICFIMNTPYEDCYSRLVERNNSDYPNKIPVEVLDKYVRMFEIPFYEEGWDEIHLINHPDSLKTITNLNQLMRNTDTFNQHNQHHTQSLGQHLFNTRRYIESKTNNIILQEAAKYHDIGKLFTQSYKKDDPNAHYYNHANIGTYALMYGAGIHFEDGSFDEKSTLEWLFYINYHMKKYEITTEKAIEKYKKIFGEEKFNNLNLLNEADSNRPTNYLNTDYETKNN